MHTPIYILMYLDILLLHHLWENCYRQFGRTWTLDHKYKYYLVADSRNSFLKKSKTNYNNLKNKFKANIIIIYLEFISHNEMWFMKRDCSNFLHRVLFYIIAIDLMNEWYSHSKCIITACYFLYLLYLKLCERSVPVH